MSRGPLPSNLCLLSSLPRYAEGDKVRFVGSVTAYCTQSGTALLCGQQRGVVAVVDLELVLKNLTHETTQVGQWINIIGTINSQSLASRTPSSLPRQPPGTQRVHVQVLLAWSTGPMDIQKYEATVGAAEKPASADGKG